MISADLVLTDIGELVTLAGAPSLRRGKDASILSIIENGAFAVRDGLIVWVGSTNRISLYVDIENAPDTVDCSGKVITPGFVDSHTHPLFGKPRQEEFAMRAAGADYEEIAKAGGGILNSVENTRNTSDMVLKENLIRHLSTMLDYGTTTVEVKSGYGLDLETEIRCLDIVKKLSPWWSQMLVPTFLGAHEVPLEYKNRADDYLDFLICEVLPVIAEKKLARFVDIFCEKGVFTPEQSYRYLTAAKEMEFGIKLHADEFHDTDGAGIAVDLDAVSADHLLSISGENMKRLADSNTVATLLPGTALFLGKPFPPGRKLIDAGAGVAIATDFNPGSCFCESMPFMINLAVCQCGMTVEEALVSATINGAAAVELTSKKGSIETGKDADFIIWDTDDYRSIAYHLAVPDIIDVFTSGMSRCDVDEENYRIDFGGE